MKRSELFVPYRSVGFVADDCGFHLQKLGADSFATVSIGRTWQVFNLDKLRLVMTGAYRPSPIRCLVAVRDVTYTSCGADILVWKRQQQIGKLTAHAADITRMLQFGSTLLTVDEEDVVCVWALDSNPKKKKKAADMRLKITAFAGEERKIISLSHPSTYLNKVLFGFDNGDLELWNVRTGKMVHRFSPESWQQVGVSDTSSADLADLLGLDTSSEAEKKASPVLCIEQSPAVDVVALGLANGIVVLYNLRSAEALIRFRQREGAVTCVSFRTDGKFHFMSTGSPQGHIAVWNLTEKRLQTTIRDAHDGNVVSCRFLQGEPVMLTSGTDNTLKMWIFDQADHSARLLKSREGHSAPPTAVQFYGKREKGVVNQSQLLSTGLDRSLRCFSILRDQQSAEFSQGSLAARAKMYGVGMESLRLPLMRGFATSTAKEREWANVVSWHEGQEEVRTWVVQDKALSKRVLLKQGSSFSPATAACISACGNFAVCGYQDGAVHIFNIQSGFYRASFVDASQGQQRAHDSAVTGVAVDGVNQTLITCGLEGSVKFWDFREHALLGCYKLSSNVNQMVFQRDSDLVACSTDDLEVFVLDIAARKPVRRFAGHRNRISDMTFSPDGRWLVTASMDGTVRVFDLPSGKLVDWFAFNEPVTSLAFSPQSDFLATTHVGNVGIFLWANRSYFSNVFYRSSITAPYEMDLPELSSKLQDVPLTQGEEEEEAREREGDGSDESTGFGQIQFAPPRLPFEAEEDADLLTLSALPKSKWKHLSTLEIVKERNKPTEKPAAPPSAPFFLATTAGVAPELDVTGTKEEMEAAAAAKGDHQSRIMQNATRQESTFIRLLKRTVDAEGGEGESVEPQSKKQKKAAVVCGGQEMKGEAELSSLEKVTVYLKGLSPAAIDAQVRLLGVDFDSEVRDLALMLHFFHAALQTHTNVEFLAAVLSLFLKIHGEAVARYPHLLFKLQLIAQEHRAIWDRLQEKLHASMCLVNMFTGTQT